MNKAKAIAAIVIVAVVVVGIYLVSRPKTGGRSSSPAAKQSQPANSASNAGRNANTAPNPSITIPMSAQNNSGETGTAVLTDEKGKTKVTVNMTGEPNGATQPSHIHVGACATPGPAGAVKYPLSPLVNGKAETTIDVSLSDLLKSLPLMINFHKSASEITVYTACGDIMMSPSGAPASSSPSPSSAAPVPATQPAPSSGTGSYGGY